MPRTVECCLRHFQQNPVLRVHPFGFARRDVEMPRVKHVGIGHHPARIDKSSLATAPGQINIQLVRGELRNHLAALNQPVPEFRNAPRAGKLARQPDDGDQPGACVVHMWGKGNRTRGFDGLAQMGGHRGNCRMQEKIRDRECPVQHRLQPVMHAGHMQGRRTKIKEVGGAVQIVRIHPKRCGQLACDHLFDAVRACHAVRGLRRFWQGSCLQRAPVHLAIGAQRQTRQRHEPTWHRIIGQTGGKSGAQGRLIHAIRHAIGDQHLVGVIGPRPIHTDAGHNHRLFDTRLRLQRRLDLAQFNPEATDFHLSVDPAQIMHHTLRILAYQIAGAVQHHIRVPRGRDKFLSRKVWLAQIAKRQPLACGKQFTRLAHGYGLHIRPQNKDIRAADGPANRQRQAQFGLGAGNGMAAGKGGIFCRAIAVDHSQVRAGRHHAGHRRGRHHIAAGQQLAQGGKIAGPCIGHGMKQPCRQPHRGDALRLDHRAKRTQRSGHIFRQYQRATVQQCPPDFQRCRIECDG